MILISYFSPEQRDNLKYSEHVHTLNDEEQAVNKQN